MLGNCRSGFTAEKEKLEKEYEGVRLALEDLADKAARDSAVFVAADGIEKEITLDKIAAAHKPNDMNYSVIIVEEEKALN